ncbi:3-phosphoshikimate 1-carboxyvinyltransferase [Arthrobacter caoxuetaonis]|uniref:3-phosphoshikimate 1-carboxyvinyltransferase n=1 Tax=Arthrobacter caoxuetaonis TaxID=2886935 RepID=A0A9X1MBZ3_9MICC|nr:3-phosphoshikimate 1-carboxyvinyltransferase [Arthrobacter caoxuetaonis]MCC3296555.1 3-phosphoshikimate 1-carboxyvinyltransferase [Arthrobacter caoxuetaonis]USQ56615.1 3-phosphoshikimate 1-carboxyvinyltransferase [Arthrobacter caoxuetaonis]
MKGSDAMYLSVLGTAQRICGEALVPNSKYHAHRALILASLAPGTSRITGLTDARHVHYTVEMLRRLGTRIEIDGGTYVVHGGPYRPARQDISAGSSGTTLYFMVGLAALGSKDVTVTGQKYFQRRPIGPLLAALRQMGLDVDSPTDCPPIKVRAKAPTGGEVHIAGTLSQWISGLLLLAPFASHPTAVVVDGTLNERTYLHLTVQMMRRFGLRIDVSEDWHRFEIPPGQQAVPTDMRIPPDIGSAAFGLAAAALHPADLLLHGLQTVTSAGADHPEADFLDVAASMGLPMKYDAAHDAVRVRHDGVSLQPAEIDCRTVPDMLPILSVMAAGADGESIFRNVAHVRLKESDRVAAMLQLNSMGAEVRISGSDLRVRGSARLTGADLSSFNDHRVLMSLAVAASAAEGLSTLTYPNAYRISYPEFLKAMNSFGLSMQVQDGKAARRPASRGTRPRQGRTPALDIEAAARVTAPDWVRRWAAERPARTAVVDGRPQDTGHLTWAELDAGADRIAAMLLDLGVRAGDRVAFQLPNWSEFVLLTVAALRIGAVAAPIMPIFREREVAFALHRSGAAVVVVPEEFRGRHYAAELSGILAAGSDPDYELAVRHVLVIGAAAPPLPVRDRGVRWHGWEQELAETPVDRERIDAAAPDAQVPAQLLFTSGTTGEPKGVLHRHSTLSRAAAMQARQLGLGGGDAIFVPSPLAHQTGFLYGMWLSFVLGTPQILQSVWDPVRALNMLRAWQGTFVQAATPFLDDLVKAVEAGSPAPRSLRIFVNTGAAVPRHLSERATRVLDAAVCGAFGTTETCLGAVSTPGDDPALVWGTDGQLLPGVQARIVSDDGHPLPAGTEGNFELLSPTLFEGYLDRPDLTKEAFTDDGWYRTGDLATLDDAGYLRITGRVRDVINRGGEKIPVAEIEQLLYRHPKVDDVALAAMPDPRLGERACAFVVPAGTPPTLRELTDYLDRCRVAKHYWPERLELLSEIPRNPVGKVQKFLLRDQARQLAGKARAAEDRSPS